MCIAGGDGRCVEGEVGRLGLEWAALRHHWLLACHAAGQSLDSHYMVISY